MEEILSLDCFLAEPQLFYGWAKEFIYRLDDFHPAAVHRVLARLEEAGRLDSVYTQNIDLLHRKAGSRRVYELHGSPAQHHCLRCRRMFSYREIAPLVLDDRIPRCECGGLIKPDIVFYGENLDEALLDRAFAELGRARLLLVLGSSLTVQPAASLPLATCRGGGKIVIVNASRLRSTVTPPSATTICKRFSTRWRPRRGSEEEPSGPFRICASCVC